uniref:Uncharacterized protein n=1 Tax=Arundo donax TaxID=35708 RepID=A0A0A9G593_ARUDO
MEKYIWRFYVNQLPAKNAQPGWWMVSYKDPANSVSCNQYPLLTFPYFFCFS